MEPESRPKPIFFCWYFLSRSHSGSPKVIPVPSRIPEALENLSRLHLIQLPILAKRLSIYLISRICWELSGQKRSAQAEYLLDGVEEAVAELIRVRNYLFGCFIVKNKFAKKIIKFLTRTFLAWNVMFKCTVYRSICYLFRGVQSVNISNDWLY